MWAYICVLRDDLDEMHEENLSLRLKLKGKLLEKEKNHTRGA
jgi:hypothetical protein